MVIRARKLRNKITVQQPTETVDSVGEPITSWATYVVRTANVMPQDGTETWRQEQYDSNANMVFQLRWDKQSKDITTKMRVSYDSRVFDIMSVVNVDEMNREIKLICSEET